MRRAILGVLLAVLLLPGSPATAACRIAVTDAWMRPVYPGSTVTAAYFDLRSSCGGELERVDSPYADSVVLHGATESGTMATVPRLIFSPGQTLRLEAGGRHVMLRGVRQPVAVGDRVPLRLFLSLDGTPLVHSLAVPVREQSAASGHAHH